MNGTTVAPIDARQLRTLLGSPYQGYAYSYPHKSAYRPLTSPEPLADVWRHEDMAKAGVYVHIPFCEMRCGFCNLFTAANAPGDAVERYLSAVERECDAAAEAIGPFLAKSLTVGGGTPTFLDARQLERLFDLLTARLGCDAAAVPAMVETSPKTATAERLGVLASVGVDRVSIGAQSFIEAETKALGRPQKTRDLTRALDAIRSLPFSSLNIDLIYGAAPQTPESWRNSLREALRWSPDEIFLYPLYVRPLTGLDGRAETWDAHRLSLYRTGRDFLLAEGYTQISMRMFRRASGEQAAGSADGEAGWPHEALLGLGCGARSRTSGLHYSTAFAVGRAAVLSIIGAYCGSSRADFGAIRYGVALDRDAQMRRAVLRSVLSRPGLDLARFEARFGVSAIDYLPELAALADLGMLETSSGYLMPTASGFERADAIGPLLYAPHIKSHMKAFELR